MVINMLKIMIRTAFFLILYGWQTDIHATEVWDRTSDEAIIISGYNGYSDGEEVQVMSMELSTQEDYRIIDRSYEPVSLKTIQELPPRVVQEAAFCHDFEFSPTPLSPVILKEFIRIQPNLLKLNIGGNLLRDEGIKPISALRLVALGVEKNGITNTGLKDTIAPITTLKSLDLSENYFDIEGLRSIAAVIANLQDLRCSFIPLGDAGAELISKNARQLQTLSLRGINLSQRGLALLTSLGQLTQVDISYNTIPAQPLAYFIEAMQRKNVTVIADYMSH